MPSSLLSLADRRRVADSVSRAVDGGQSAQDDRFRSPSDAEFIRALAAEAAGRLEGQPAVSILRWAADVLPRFVVTSSFGAESAVLLHMLVACDRDVPVFFLDTGYHFDDTVAYRRRLARQWHLTVLDVAPEYSPAQQDQLHGVDLFRTDPDSCCQMRKTQPLRRALANCDGWASGVRRSQTPERVATPIVEARQLDGRWVTKVAPLAAWSDADVLAYQAANDLPPHPLTALGYASVGCAPCTLATGSSTDARAGRWAGMDKSECGIHLPGDGNEVKRTTTPG